jgi:hypothetical protein
MNVKLSGLVCLAGVASAVPALGCTAVMQSLEGGGMGGRRAPGEGGVYTGAECGRWQAEDARSDGVFRGYSDDAERRPIFEGDRPVGARPIVSATFVTCVDQTGGNGASSNDAIVADHFDFDDRRFDHLRASAMVMDCAMNPGCSPEQNNRDVLGMMAGYAKRIDPAAAEAALGADGGSKELRAAFSAKLSWARAVIDQRVAQLDARRKELWVDVPEQVWTERHEYFAQHSSLYAALDPLLAAIDRGTNERDLTATASEIRALRGRYLDACKAEGCMFTPFVLETTRALTLLAVRTKDVTQAMAEADLLADDRLSSQYFSRAMLAALLPAAQREAERYQKYSRARSDGADAASLEAMFGKTPPVNVSPDGPSIVWGSKSQPNLTSAMDQEEIESTGGNVKGTRKHGEVTVVSFADIVTTWDEEDCHETNRIDGIGSDGQIIYRQSCKKVGTRTERKKVEPIEVPHDEAAKLKAGEYVFAYVNKESRRGAIIDVQREHDLVQVRGHRLKVKEVRRKRYGGW